MLELWMVAGTALPSPAYREHRAAARNSVIRASLSPGSEVIVAGGGPVLLLTAKLAAMRGFKTTCAVNPQDFKMASSLIHTVEHPECSLPLSFLLVAGPEANSDVIDAAIAKADAAIFAFDSEQTISETMLDFFAPPASKLKHISIMSRSLNGEGMGFFASAAKVAANAEIWAGGPAIESYRAADALTASRAREIGARYTIVRAGTLKGGSVADALNGGAGHSGFLSPLFYQYGQQDVVNWRLLYDCAMLGVTCQKGDVLPGPGFTAALTATSPEGGPGDSHRGAVAAALVAALCFDAAANCDFSIGSAKHNAPPTDEEWGALFAKA